MYAYQVYYKTPQHYLEVKAFTEAAEAQAALLRAIVYNVYGSDSALKVVVFAPEPGTLRQFIGIILIGAVGIAKVGFELIESDIGKAAVEGYFGEEPAAYVKEAFQDLRRWADQKALEEQIEYTNSVERIIGDVSQFILQCDPDLLEGAINERRLPKQLADGYSRFYEACLEDPLVEEVVFPRTSDRPVDRGGFAHRAMIRRRVEEENLERRFVEIATITAFSPNWNKDNQKRRGWVGRLISGGERHFKIEDEEFWSRVAKENLSSGQNTTMQVQWPFTRGKGGPTDFRVHRVLSFNGVSLSEPLREDALAAILGDFTPWNEYVDIHGEMDPRQISLFGDD